MLSNPRVRAVAGSLALFWAWGTGLAQEAETGPDEILVTARKRVESLQDVPISIATLNSDELQARGLNSDYDISNFTIGFRTLPQTGRDIDRPTIRGMGAPVSRGEPNASYFIDGTFVSGSISTATTSAVERVEVLRGPQSAQFGRATFAGAVNYVTRKPTETFQGQVNGRAGTSEDYSIGGWASGPIVADNLYYVVSANQSHYGGQWRNSLEPGQASYEGDSRLPFRLFLLDPPQEGDHSKLGEEQTTDFLGKLVWRPAEGSEVTLKYGYTKGDDSHFPSLIATELNCYVPVPGTEGEPWYNTSTGYYCGEFKAEGRVNRINIPDLRDGVTYILANNFPDPSDYTVPPSDVGTFRTQDRILFEYTQDLAGYTVTSRGSWNHDDFKQLFDLDHTQTRAIWGLFHFDNRRVIDDWSAELRIDTPGDRALRGALGVYYYSQDRENKQRSYVGPGVVFGAGATTTDFPPSSFIDVTNKAVFGGIDWDFAERWTLSLEGRYAEDTKNLSGGALGVPGVPASVEQDVSSFTPRITVRFEPNDDLTLYALVAKGNKPSDFNTEFFRSGVAPEAVSAGLNGCVPPASGPLPVLPCLDEPLALVKEEEQWTYEVGAKARWLGGRLSTNLATYYIDWTNQGLFATVCILQTTGTCSTTTIIRNVGTSEVRGLELETSFQVNDRLTLLASYGYTDSRYLEGTDTVLEEVTGDGNIHNKTVPNVPLHTLILGASVSVPVTDRVNGFLNLDYALSSKRYTAPTNLNWIGNDQTVNLRAGIETGAWTVTAYVRNLLDDDTPVAALDFVNFGTVDPNYPVNQYGNLLNDQNADCVAVYGAGSAACNRDPRMFSLNPKRGRDVGLELQYRF